MKPIRRIKIARNMGFAAFLFACLSCSQEKPTEDSSLQPGASGTSEAIVGDDPNLAKPRPAPIGDTAETEEQKDQLGNLPENVDSAARGLK